MCIMCCNDTSYELIVMISMSVMTMCDVCVNELLGVCVVDMCKLYVSVVKLVVCVGMWWWWN